MAHTVHQGYGIADASFCEAVGYSNSADGTYLKKRIFPFRRRMKQLRTVSDCAFFA